MPAFLNTFNPLDDLPKEPREPREGEHIGADEEIVIYTAHGEKLVGPAQKFRPFRTIHAGEDQWNVYRFREHVTLPLRPSDLIEFLESFEPQIVRALDVLTQYILQVTHFNLQRSLFDMYCHRPGIYVFSHIKCITLHYQKGNEEQTVTYDYPIWLCVFMAEHGYSCVSKGLLLEELRQFKALTPTEASDFLHSQMSQ